MKRVIVDQEPIELPATTEAHIEIHKRLMAQIERGLAAIGVSVGEVYDEINLHERADERLHRLCMQQGGYLVAWWRVWHEEARDRTMRVVGQCGVAAERFWEWKP